MSSEYWTKARGEKILPIERSLLHGLAEYVAETFDNPTIVNIGVSWGASVHCLHAGAPDARLVAIDIDLETRPVQGLEHLEGVKFVEDKSCPRGLQFRNDVHLLFIDGDHSYNGVKDDINGWLGHIPLKGIIAFHDFEASVKDARRLAGVRQAVQDWYKRTDGKWPMRWSAGSIVAFQRVK